MEPAASVGMALSTKIILWIVGLAVVGGVGYGVATRSDAPSDGAGAMFSGDVFSLVGRGGDWKCTWSFDQEGALSSGTVWVSGKNFKSEAQVDVGGSYMTATAIGDGEYMYSWTSAIPTGMKFRMDEAQKMSDEPSASGKVAAQTEQFNQEYDYDCSKWKADSATFEIPTNITFTDFSAMMQGGPMMMGDAGVNVDASANIDVEALMKQFQVQ